MLSIKSIINGHTFRVRYLKPKDFEAINNGIIFEIYKKEGEIVKKDEKIVRIETAKADIEELAIIDGTIEKIHVKLNQEIEPNTYIYSIRSLDY